jgi:hypothetical protein
MIYLSQSQQDFSKRVADAVSRGMTMRFFFDCTTKDQSLYDYQGTEFHNSQAAIEFAEAMAEMLGASLAGEWKRWSVEIRNAEGKKLGALRVGTVTPLAA